MGVLLNRPAMPETCFEMVEAENCVRNPYSQQHNQAQRILLYSRAVHKWRELE